MKANLWFTNQLITCICFAIFSSTPIDAQVQPSKFEAPLKPGEREYAKRIDADLAKGCPVSGDECQRTNLILQAQMRLGAWGYGIKFTAKADPETAAAIRLYQKRNGLAVTGRLDGLTVLRMEADEKEIAEPPFSLPPFYFLDEQFTYLFGAEGVFRDTSTGQTSGPIKIQCDKDQRLCIETESTPLEPDLMAMTIKEWTPDRIVAEDEKACYSHQLRIERATRTIVHTSIKAHKAGFCAPMPGDRPSFSAEELVDGFEVNRQRGEARWTAERRIKLFPNALPLALNPVAGK